MTPLPREQACSARSTTTFCFTSRSGARAACTSHYGEGGEEDGGGDDNRYTCRVYDFGSRRKRWPGEGLELCVPSALWWGLEVARYSLAKLWRLPGAAAARCLLHGHDASSQAGGVLPRGLAWRAPRHSVARV